MVKWTLPGPLARAFSGDVSADMARHRPLRLRISMDGIAVYAVGDVHGCHDELLALERVIQRDATQFPGRKLIIMLGDYVDRGPGSAAVLDHLCADPPAGFDRLCLIGNHDLAMLDYLEGRAGFSGWMAMGALPTLHSYGIDVHGLSREFGQREGFDEAIRAAIPNAHVDFLRRLPILLDSGKFLFVHAGIRPGIDIAEQSDEDLLYIRRAFHESPHDLPRYVVHGHTPVDAAEMNGRRVNLDTGAFFSGRLTALRIWQGRGRLLSNLHQPARSAP
jgi:serine/threonine protein phosphatase 1